MSRRKSALGRNRTDEGAIPSLPVVRPMPRWAEGAIRYGTWVVVAAAAVARLIHWLSVRHGDPTYAQTMPGFDMDTYWSWGRSIAAGDWLSRSFTGGKPFYYGPLYPYFLGLVFRLFGPSFEAVHIAQALVGLAAPVCLWLVTRRMFGPPAALWAGILGALCAPFLFYDQILLMEGLLVAVHSAILLFLARGQDSSRRAWLWAAAAGVCSGVACLGRGNFLLAVPMLAVWWLALPALGRKESNSQAEPSHEPSREPFHEPSPQFPSNRLSRSLILIRGACLAGAYVAGALLVLSLSLWRNHHVSGQWVLTTTNGPVNLYMGNAHDAPGYFAYPPSYQAIQDEAKKKGVAPAAIDWTAELAKDARAHPGAFVSGLLNKTWIFWNSYDAADNLSYYLGKRYSWLLRLDPAGWLLIVPLGAMGAWESRRSWRRQVFLYVYVVGFSLSIIAVFVSGRYRIEILLPMLIWAGAAMSGIVRRAWERRWASLIPRLAALALGAALLWPAWSPALPPQMGHSPPAPALPRPNDYINMINAHLKLGQRDEAEALSRAALADYPSLQRRGR